MDTKGSIGHLTSTIWWWVIWYLVVGHLGFKNLIMCQRTFGHLTLFCQLSVIGHFAFRLVNWHFVVSWFIVRHIVFTENLLRTFYLKNRYWFQFLVILSVPRLIILDDLRNFWLEFECSIFPRVTWHRTSWLRNHIPGESLSWKRVPSFPPTADTDTCCLSLCFSWLICFLCLTLFVLV